MPRDETKDAARGGFATTRWSLVLAAGKGDDTARSRAALETLCASYWYPVYGYVRRRGIDVTEAADLTQDFFAFLLERRDLGLADESRGRFRSFLLTCVKNFLANARDRARALKRGGGRQVLSLDVDEAEGRYRLEPEDDRVPEAVFERAWALTLLDRVVERLGEEYEAAGKQRVFTALRPLLTQADERIAYRQLADELDTSEGAIKVAVHRLRQRYGALLRSEIAETLHDPAAVEEEIRGLFRALGS